MHLGLILGVFAVIFLAELPDKTMIATLIMGSRSRPVLVWIGVTAAFGVHVAMAVVAGRLIALLPHVWVEGITALLFAGGAAYLLLVSEEEEVAEGEAAPSSCASPDRAGPARELAISVATARGWASPKRSFSWSSR